MPSLDEPKLDHYAKVTDSWVYLYSDYLMPILGRVFVGVGCISRDEKQIDFAEQVESVAYVLCGESPITLDKFCQIFKAKGGVSVPLSIPLHAPQFSKPCH
uniref:(California timema) hypothetical protein n=1 Tax=Timema californicum TaxID=61474 RepID=A0A7R9J3U2_TIMCA|nr:unnamed protein product [Timema californicum]